VLRWKITESICENNVECWSRRCWKWGTVTRLNAVQPSGLVGVGYGVGFNLNGGLWDSLSPAQFFCFPHFCVLPKMI
jgi:hypothetical protein